MSNTYLPNHGVNPEMAALPDGHLIHSSGDDPQVYLDAGRIVVYDDATLYEYLSSRRGEILAEMDLRHELAHKRAAEAVGLPFDFYSFITDANRHLVQIHFKETNSIPRLAIGAVSLAPFDPSEGDYKNARYFGYNGIKEVGDRVVEWNRTKQGIHIPAPLSYLPVRNDVLDGATF